MKRPNLIFIFSDQHRKSAMGFWQRPEFQDYILGRGDPVSTPNLDKLANDGIVVSGAYSSYPVCSPFRAMLFSGRYPAHNGVWQNCAPGRPDELLADIPTFTDALSDGGYSVGYVGKWHLERPAADFAPDGRYIGDEPEYSGERVFPDGSADSNTACWDTLIPRDRQRKIDYLYAYNTWDVFRARENTPELEGPHYWDKEQNRHTAPKGMWAPDYEAELAIRFLKNEGGVRDVTKPYALFVGFNPPHSPYTSRMDTDLSAFDEIYRNADHGKLIARENVKIDNDKFKMQTKVYFSHVTGIDRCIGKILDTLPVEERENTIVIFTADHGDMLGSHGLMAKNVPYEEATAIPFIIRYPAELAPRCEPLFLTGVDIMPTVLSLCGIKIPEGVEGRSYAELLRRGSGKRPDSALFVQPSRKGVRTEKYLFTLTYESDEAFKDARIYDLAADPYQLCPLAPADIAEDELRFLRAELGKYLAASSDPWYEKRLYSDFIIYPHAI